MQIETLALGALLAIGRAGRWLLGNPDEACGALFGLVGAFLLAGNGKHARWGWVAFLASNAALLTFAWRLAHPGLFVLQLGFTYTSTRGIWIWILKPRLGWHDWRGDFAGNATMHIMHLVRRASGWKLDLHKMVAPDAPGCYHTHPAKAWRLVLWNGYVEELEDGTRVQWWPLRFGRVDPELSHRIAALPRGTSYSLWLRAPRMHDIQLRGPGWSAPEMFTGAGAPAPEDGEIARMAAGVVRAMAVRELRRSAVPPQMMRDFLQEIERKHSGSA